jgi:hypothetical protein
MSLALAKAEAYWKLVERELDHEAVLWNCESGNGSHSGIPVD